MQCRPTDEIPLAARHEDILLDDAGRAEGEVQLGAVVRPRAELHRAALVVEREPADVDGARRDEDAERRPLAAPVRPDLHLRPEVAVNRLVRAGHHHQHTRRTTVAPLLPRIRDLCFLRLGANPSLSSTPLLSSPLLLSPSPLP